jgi:hypothetical protein
VAAATVAGREAAEALQVLLQVARAELLVIRQDLAAAIADREATIAIRAVVADQMTIVAVETADAIHKIAHPEASAAEWAEAPSTIRSQRYSRSKLQNGSRFSRADVVQSFWIHPQVRSVIRCGTDSFLLSNAYR